jgi:hypothetical protein
MVVPRQPIGLKRDAAEPPGSDPRRSYDRGAWAGPGEDEDASDAPSRAPPSALAGIPTDLLRRELDRRQRGLDTLLAKRDALRAEIAELDAQIRELKDEDRPPGRAARGGGKRSARLALPRPRNAISLPDAIALEIEAGQTVTPAEAAKRVLANGYRTTAKTFTMVVANALSKDKRFKRIGRGNYERVG